MYGVGWYTRQPQCSKKSMQSLLTNRRVQVTIGAQPLLQSSPRCIQPGMPHPHTCGTCTLYRSRQLFYSAVSTHYHKPRNNMLLCRVEKLILLANAPVAQFRNADLRQKMASSYFFFFGCPWLPERLLQMSDFQFLSGMFSKPPFNLLRRCAQLLSLLRFQEWIPEHCHACC